MSKFVKSSFNKFLKPKRMFKKFRIKNYRTHRDTTIELQDVTLLIGANNSGKTNLLSALSFFSGLVRRAHPESKQKKIEFSDIEGYRHSLAKQDEPICLSCEWSWQEIHIEYEIQINYKCLVQEKIIFTSSDGIRMEKKHGYEEDSSEMLLRTKLLDNDSDDLKYIENFFWGLSLMYYYNFQPAFLKEEGFTDNPVKNKNRSIKDFKKLEKNFAIAELMGKEGEYFQELIVYAKENEEQTYNKFLAYLRRFVKSFHGLSIGSDGKVRWQFDMGGADLSAFDARHVSDGLLKAGAVALLCAMRRPPAVIMIEEVENGINQKNLAEFLRWLRDTASGGSTQFIITSHSPSVIREFAHHLDAVYNVYLRQKDYKSVLTNLNEAVKPMVSMGVVADEGIIERNGKEVALIRPYEITELFYNGVLGEI